MSNPAKKIIDPFSTYSEINLLILKENIERSQDCFDNISQLVRAHKPVPANLFKEWHGYFLLKEEVETNYQIDKLTKVAEKTILRFSDDKYYEFDRVKKNKQKIVFDFKECIYTIIQGYHLNIWCLENKKNKSNDTKLQIKKGAVRYFYDALAKFTEHYNSKEKLFISNYQKIVIAAYITNEYVYKIISKKDFTNKELQQVAKKFVEN